VLRAYLSWVLGGAMLGMMCSAAAGAADAAQEPGVARDLTSVIALLGLPCGEVVSVRKQGDNDNVATCRNGNRYRVYVNAEGRVVAERQK
jgi:hypothetical protein